MSDAPFDETADWAPQVLDELQLWLWEEGESNRDWQAVLRQARQRFPTIPDNRIEEAMAEVAELLSLEDELFQGRQDDERIVKLGSFDDYEIRTADRDSIHRGGLSSVHGAFDKRFGRRIAIKLPLKQFTRDQDVCRRVIREANVCARLQHPNIVPIYDVGEYEPEGCPYFVMKYVEGVTLRERIQNDGIGVEHRLSHLQIVREVVQTLAHAHSCRIIHRDLKPDNIMVGHFGEVHLLDWGLARDDSQPETTSSRQRALERFSQTVPGGVFGTLAYMAPEQALGHTDQHSHKTDVFGVGGVLCFVLTGQALYTGDRATVLSDAKKCCTEPAIERLRNAQAPRALIQLIEQCLLLEPGQRPTMQQVSERLGAYIDGLEQAALRFERRSRLAVTLLAATALIVVVSVAGLAILHQYDERLQSEQLGLAASEARATAQLESVAAARQSVLARLHAPGPPSETPPSETPLTETPLLDSLRQLQRRIDAIEVELAPASAFPRSMERLEGLRDELKQDTFYAKARSQRLSAAERRRQQAELLCRNLREAFDYSGSLFQQMLYDVQLPAQFEDMAYPSLDQERRLAAFQQAGLDWQMLDTADVASFILDLEPANRRELVVHLWLWHAALREREKHTQLRNQLGAVLHVVAEKEQLGLPPSVWEVLRSLEVDSESVASRSDWTEDLLREVRHVEASREGQLILASSLLDMGERSAAYTLGSHLVASHPADPLVLSVVGYLWTRSPLQSEPNSTHVNFREAGAECLRAWRTVTPSTGLLLAQHCLLTEREQEAIDILGSMKVQGSSASCQSLMIAVAQARLGNSQQAIQSLSRVNDDRPDTYWPKIGEAIVLADLNRPDQASVALKFIQSHGCSEDLSRFVTAVIAIKGSRFSQAIELLEEMQRAGPFSIPAGHWLSHARASSELHEN